MRRLLTIVSLLLMGVDLSSASACIPNTPCQCQFVRHSFLLVNCLHSLPNIPILNSNTPANITEISARSALIRWPLNLCQYSQLRELDLSGSYLDFKQIDLSCLPRLIHLNLSATHLNGTPNFRHTSLKLLQTLDLSNNQIETIDGHLFRSLESLATLWMQSNPLKQVNAFDELLALPRLQSMNLITSSSALAIKQPLNITRWMQLAHQWNSSNRSLLIRTNSISLQSLFPAANQLSSMPTKVMKIIFATLSNSFFTTLFFTPKCHCSDLRSYQRIFSFTNDNQNLSSLFQFSTCLMPNGIIHARLFDRRTLADLNCSVTAKIAIKPVKQKSSSTPPPPPPPSSSSSITSSLLLLLMIISTLYLFQ
jgi:Leucine-rich repeat (LRR) protein